MSGREEIIRSQTVERIATIAGRLEDLTHLEEVIAGITIDSHRHTVIVENKGVISLTSVEEESATTD